ncbi:hypothetical protein EI692_08075 [Bacillus safensis]|nr:hypothetical protein EI692_08075 [Bacillus safensis]
MSVLRFGAHECQIRSAPVLVLSRLQRFSITLKRRQSPKSLYSLGFSHHTSIIIGMIIGLRFVFSYRN